jgi:transaldolase
MSKNIYIDALNQLGQSVWYDNVSRQVLTNGELQALIDAGVSGLTSNPTIFKKAIADTDFYDKELEELGKRGLTADEICETVMIKDLSMVAEMLRPVYDSTGGADGYGSIEVSPLLAEKTAATVEAATRIWNKLDEPNIMIKIPGTEEGIPAVREAIAAGINVNVTLIFAVNVYSEVIDAYLSGLEDRVGAGKDVSSIASVASFFVSRVDAICEKTLAKHVADGLIAEDAAACFTGKPGIANSKAAYALFEERFGSDRFAALKSKGARVQRPLWASTGTKNPAFKSVLYVEELAGRDTVNTLPPKTLKELMNEAVIEPRLHNGADEAVAVLSKLKDSGVDFDALLDELQDAGVTSFSNSYKDLVASIESKRHAMV